MTLKEAVATVSVVATLVGLPLGTKAIVDTRNEACHQQQAIVDGIYTILDRSTQHLHRYVREGVISQAQADQAREDNAAAKRDIARPTC